ncbi:uncharacterized oxidoreductase dhs-27-like isoform X1 [Toxorhynchites rutilus septentrionalis]|uniref:uncharacterized oxidoreductase dhs-27-like isoform X1 n=1 Tax=Toxorhynchites rutilus septentrionalis TaxID=329112 RepID=UPI002478834C|nr:uncharacterized oxidoreductase dhs-27-like isoform X1 [Toxorhynchites rutilus septentrionalis]
MSEAIPVPIMDFTSDLDGPRRNSGSFVLREEVPIVDDTGRDDGSFVLREAVPIIDNGCLPLPAYVEESIVRVVPQEGFTPGRFSISIDGLKGCEGLIGELYNAVVKEEDISRELSILCKIPPLDPIRRARLNSTALFEREINVYANVLPALFEFQREKGVTEEMNAGFFNVPRCYFTHFDAGSEEALILLENLRARKFSTWNKLEPMNYEHTRLVMTQLGKFHALSLAVKDQRPDLFLHCKLPDAVVPAMQESAEIMNMVEFALEAVIHVLDPQEEKARWKVEGLRYDFFETLKSSVDPQRAEPYAVLNHGDCWVNNLMFQYQNGTPREIIFLDWQLIRYGSPALDVLYFLFCCTDQPFRNKHFDEIVRIYYTALKELLEELGSDPMEVFPFTALLRHLKTFGKFAVIMCALDIPILCTDPADIRSHEDAASAFAESIEAQQRYQCRMGGVVRDAVKYGYL